MMIKKIPEPEVNEANIERALGLWAMIIADLGAVQYVPIFERLEKELKLYKEASDPVARARAVLKDQAKTN
jgi:hypothetical protein